MDVISISVTQSAAAKEKYSKDPWRLTKHCSYLTHVQVQQNKKKYIFNGLVF